MRRTLFSCGMAFIPFFLFSQTADTCRLKLGMNFTWINNFNYELPFADLMKSCGTWMTQDVSGGNPFQNTGVLDSIPGNAEGYPLSLPRTVGGQGQQQTLATIMAQGTGGNYPGGSYTVLYDGTGTFQFGLDATVTGQSGNTVTLNVTPSNNGIYMKLLSSSAGDPVRNIRVLMPGTENTYQSQPFHRDFLDRIAPFRVLRFMNWTFTNNNDNVSWSNRRLPSYYTQATYGTVSPRLGCAWEHIIRLANQVKKDVWINVPHMADSAYIANMAVLFRDSMDASLKIYLEYSNEVWNSSFGQSAWVNANGVGNNLSQKTAYFTKRVFDTWTGVFGSQSARLVKVAACFLGQVNVGTEIMNYLAANNSKPDALSPAAYFGLLSSDYNVLASLGASATADTVISLMRSRMNSYIPQLVQHSSLALQHGVRLVFYEGGQHLIIQNSSAAYNPAIYAAQTDTGMYNLYQEWLRLIRDTTVTDLFLHFHLAGSQTAANTGGGTFGALPGIAYNTSQKYQALADHIFNCDSTPSGMVFTGTEDQEVTIYPNPSSGLFRIRLPGKINDGRVVVSDIHGRTILSVKNLSGNHFLVEGHNLPAGCYIIRVYSGDEIHAVKKVMVSER